MSAKCKICGSTKLEHLISYDRYPGSISFLHDDPVKAKADANAINFVSCRDCMHIQIGRDMPQSFYEEYVMTVSHSPKMNRFQQEQAEMFVGMFGLKGKKVLEVGCGDGNFLKIMDGLGCQVWGNEPSSPFRDLALKKGLNVDSAFVDEKFSHTSGPFDAVVSREVMEHIPEPIPFLKNLRRQIKPGGALLVEIPNAEKALRELRFYDLFPDHLSYFTRETLTAAVLLAGFTDVKIHYGMDDEFIYATCVRRDLDGAALENAVNRIREDFLRIGSETKNLVVWGAGGKGIASLSTLPSTDNIRYVVDSDPYKQGKYLPATGLKVVLPEYFYADKSADAVLITNLAYTDEILQLLNQNNFRGRKYILSKTGITFVS